MSRDPASAAAPAPELYRIGTISYTKSAMIMLFVWMLWGDFAFFMMDALTPTLLPLILKKYDASNLVIGLLVGSIPSVLNFVINPVVSTISDRTRSRWGRRIPYLLFASPLVALFMVLLGWSEQIGGWINRMGYGPENHPAMTVLLLIFAFSIGYQVFNMFVASIFFYLFADVVPTAFLGRFMALFRAVGSTAGFAYNLLVLPQADRHLPWIFTGVALMYALTFAVMCIKVKEGSYPPPEKVKSGNPFNFIKVYFTECFSIPFFLVFFFAKALDSASLVCRNVFNLLFATRELKMTLGQYGFIIAVGAAITIPLYYLAGKLVDRYHPIRVYMFGSVVIIAANIYGFFSVHDYPTFSVVAILLALAYMIQISSGLPLFVRLFPKDKYGQFCSANAMLNSVTLIVANVGGGWFIDRLGYQYIFVWDFIFTGLSLALLVWVYRCWQSLGGDQNYVPPERHL